jgi:vacuolar-type H+-ATPase subunit C/Vma6
LTQTTLYAGVLAKIGAERSNLLLEARLKELAQSKTLTVLAVQLRDTGYAETIAKLPLPLTSRRLERVFKENLIETYAKILKHSPKSVAEFLALPVVRFEVENVKTLIKATDAKLNMAQKLNLLYFLAEDILKHHAFIEEAAKAADLKQLVNSLNKTDYADALNLGIKSYEENASTTCLDVLLDKVFYEKLHAAYEALPKKEKPHALFYASMENDGFTLLILLRGKTLNYSPDWLRLAVPRDNFNIPKETVEALVTAPDFDSALNIVQKGYYAKFFTKEPTAEETIAKAEKAFTKAVFHYAQDCRILDLFDVGAPLVFWVQKEAEVRNLTALSLGVEAGWKPEDIRNQLLT